MRKYLLPLLAGTMLQAGLMDFKTLSEAKSAYEKGDFDRAAERYGRLKNKNAQTLYDYGNALYKQEKYAEASGVFSAVTDPALKQKALHNLGNSLAMQGKTVEAIHAYEEALKLGEDEATRYNLDLLKQQKEQQNQDQQDDQDQQNQQDRDDRKNDQQDQQNGDQNRSGQNQSTQNSDGSASSGHAQNEPQNNDENGQNSSASQTDGREDPAQTAPESAGSSSSAQEPQEAQGSSLGDDAAAAKQAPEAQQPQEDQAQAAMAEPISDMEERKYNQMLDKRGIKTLMIPLSGKGEPHDDETTPW